MTTIKLNEKKIKLSYNKVFFYSLTLLLLTICNTASSQGILTIEDAKRYFFEYDSICSADNGKLWGVNLYGPLMFANSITRKVYANRPDKMSVLKDSNGVFVGKLPKDIIVANTSTNWNGKDWAMIMWSAIPHKDGFSRNKLLVHESWHRIQRKIGVMPVMTLNTHLDQLEGSTLIKLELVILSKALVTETKTAIEKHLVNALSIRQYRQQLYPNNNEDVFELHEGLPEYTGFKLCGIDHQILPRIVSNQLEASLNKDCFANSYAYLTGPAYGLLFDHLKIDWIKQITQGKTITQIVNSIVNLNDSITNLEFQIDGIIEDYEAKEMVENEKTRFKLYEEKTMHYTKLLLKDNQLLIPNDNLRFSYNPQEKLIPIDNTGLVYKTMELIGEWGKIKVTDGILRTNDWKLFIVPAPETGLEGIITEKTYTLELNKGWVVRKITDNIFTFQKN